MALATNPTTLTFQEPGLWALTLGNGDPQFYPGSLHFVAGIGDIRMGSSVP
jgi:hypothetical protein